MTANDRIIKLTSQLQAEIDKGVIRANTIQHLNKESLALDDELKLEKKNHAITAACLKDEVERFNAQSIEIKELKEKLSDASSEAVDWFNKYMLYKNQFLEIMAGMGVFWRANK